MDFIFRAAEKFLKDHKRLMRYRKIFAVMAAVVVFATTYELILPAITIDRQRAADTPGMEVSVAAEETVEEEAAEESGDAEAEAEAQAEAEAAAAEEEARAAEEEAQEEAQSESGETDADVDSSDADAAESESDASQETEETAESGNENSDQNDSDSAGADSEEKTAAEEIVEETDTANAAETSTETAAADAAAAGTTAAAEQAIEYPVTLTYEGEDYTITATFDETAELPAGVTLDALEILPDMIYKDADGNVLYDDYEVYLEKTVETLEKEKDYEEDRVSSARFFDINFIDTEGYYVEPSAPVTIAVKYDEAPSKEDTVSTVAVHFDEEKNRTEIVETKEEVKKDSIQEVSFDGEKFSVYAIVVTDTEGNVTTTTGETVTLTGTSSNKSHSWSSNNSCVSVESYKNNVCTIKANGTGSATITHKYHKSSETFNVTVSAAAAESTMTLGSTSESIEAGSTKDVTVTTTGVETVSVSSADTSIASASYADGVITISALAEGSTTITVSGTAADGYTTPEEQTIAVEVTAASNPDYELENTENSGLTVTIKETGQVKKALSAYKLVVKPVSESDDEYTALESQVETDTGDTAFDFLRMYHIYFADKDDTTDTEVPYGTVLETLGIGEMNLQVTLTYDTAPEGWPTGNSVKVGHYKVKGSSVENAKVAASAGGAEANIQNIKVSGNSVTLHIKSFSVIVLSSTNSSYTDQSSSNDTGSTSSSINPEENKNTDNSWQVVEGMYGDTTWSQTSNDGYVYSSDNLFRIQKNIVPTGTENEFDVYLNVEPTLHWDFQEIFKASSIFISNSNSQTQVFDAQTDTQTSTQDIYAMTAQQFKTTFASGSGNISKLSDTASTAATSDYHTSGNKQYHVITITVLDEDGDAYKTFTTDLYYYHTTGSNITTYVVLPTNHHKMYKVHLGFIGNTNGGNVNLTMPYATYSALVNAIINDGNYSALISDKLPATVTDPMGDHIEYMDSLKVTNGSATYDASTKTITWNNFTAPAASNDSSNFEENTATSTIADYFRKNVYQMKYHIRLKTEDTDYTSQSTIPTNGTTTMTDTSNVTTNFPIPQVKGTRYKVKIRKKDQATENWIDGSSDSTKTAAFVLSGENGTVSGSNTVTATVGSDGYYTFDAELVGLDGKYSGTYYITETDAPDGYIKPAEATAISIGNYTTDSTAFSASGSLYLYKSGDDEYVTIENTPINIAVKKVDSDGPITSGVGFTLDNNTEKTVDTSGMIYWDKVSAGDHTLAESTKPDDYKAIDDITVSITDAGVVTEDSDSAVVLEDTTTVNGKVYTVIQVTNKKKSVHVIIRKTDENGWNEDETKIEFLSGAVFTLTNSDGTAIDNVTLNTESDTDGYVTSSSGVELESDKTYLLTESTAPDGYNCIEGNIIITVSDTAENRVSAQHNVTSGTLYHVEEGDNDTYTIYIPNNPGVELPETGGTGFLSPMTLCGIMAMAFVLATAVMYGFSMRRGERRYK